MKPLTPDEYQALLIIVMRAPLNVAEKIAIELILSKLEPKQDGETATK